MDKRKDKITVLEIVIAATQVLTVICIFKGNTAWKGSLSILFIGIAASLFDKLRETKERPYLYTLTEDIEELKFQKAQLLARLNCQDNGIAAKKQALKELDTALDNLMQQHTLLSGQKEADKAEFLEIRDSVAPENEDNVMAERETIRSDGRAGLVRRLYEKYRDKYSSDTFDEANRQIDAELKEQPVQKKKRSISEQLRTPKLETQQPKKQKKKEYER